MPTVCFCYSQEDREFLDKLEKQLSVMQSRGEIDIWHDGYVEVGQELGKETESHINFDEILLLLVSSDFLAAAYDMSVRRAMERHESGDAIVIPVILRACDWEATSVGKLRAVPDEGKPVSQWPDLDEALLQVVRAIRMAAEIWRQRLRAQSRVSQSSATAPLEIWFDQDCVVNRRSIVDFIQSDQPLPKIRWHSVIYDELDKLDNWWPVLDGNFEPRKPANWTIEHFREWVTGKRASITELRGKIQAIFDETPVKMRKALKSTAKKTEEIQVEVLSQLIKFSALQLIRFLQRADRFLPDTSWNERTSFPKLPRVPDWLVDLEPKWSALGALVFGEGRFLLANVGETDQSYESIVLPTGLAERLQEGGHDDMAYYRWIVPQWLHYDFKRRIPPVKSWRVYALRDGRNREAWGPNSRRPWREPS